MRRIALMCVLVLLLLLAHQEQENVRMARRVRRVRASGNRPSSVRLVDLAGGG